VSRHLSYILKLQCLSVRLSVCVGSVWKILPVVARSLWSVLGGGGRESPAKHGAGGASTGRGGGDGWERTRRGGGGGELDRCSMHRVYTTVNKNIDLHNYVIKIHSFDFRFVCI
jgi:hypothetical protein